MKIKTLITAVAMSAASVVSAADLTGSEYIAWAESNGYWEDSAIATEMIRQYKIDTAMFTTDTNPLDNYIVWAETNGYWADADLLTTMKENASIPDDNYIAWAESNGYWEDSAKASAMRDQYIKQINTYVNQLANDGKWVDAVKFGFTNVTK